jgi:hypothetical protein
MGVRRKGVAMEFNIGGEDQGNVSGHAHFDVCGRNDAVRGFDSETTWLVAGLISFAILVLTLAGQDGHKSLTDNFLDQKLARDAASLQANPGTLSNFKKLDGLSASTETTSGRMISIARTEAVISPMQNSSLPTEPSGSNRTHVSALTSEAYEPETQADSPVQRQDTVRVIHPKIRNLRHRLHGTLTLDAKSRLIALWHESLARSHWSRNRAMLWDSKSAYQRTDH